MLIRMLRADLRRGVAQSAALTVLIALAVALAAMSTTLGIRAGSAVNALWKRAVPPDVAHMHTGTPDANALRAWVDRRSDVADYHLMRTLPVPVQQLTIAGKSQADSVLEPAFVTAPKRFDLLLGQDGKPANPGPGEIALPVHYKAQGAAAVGDTVRVRSGSWVRELKVVDFVRDPQMNPSMVTSKRLVVHPSDFAEFDKRLKPEYIVEFRLADGVEASAFVKAFESSGLSSQGITVDTSIFKLMNGLTTVPVAAVALLVAILLAVVAALVLRYAFLAAMEEDLAQISVLKAIGAPPRGVKRLYLAKYSALTAGGALVGYLLSIPMAAQLSDAVLLYLGKSSAGAWPILCSIAAAVALAALMVGFCWILLRRIDRLSAVQALRTGVSGRVRRRRHRLSLASSRRLPVDVWLGLREAFRPANALLLAVLTVCTIVLILPANVVTTMGDPGFASYMGIGRADLRIDVPAGSADLDTAYSKVAAEAGVGRAVQMTDHRYDMRKPGGAWGSALVESGDQSAFSGRYLRGRAPATAKEIALSSNQADEAKVGLGDVVDVRLPASQAAASRGLRGAGQRVHLPDARRDAVADAVGGGLLRGGGDRPGLPRRRALRRAGRGPGIFADRHPAGNRHEHPAPARPVPRPLLRRAAGRSGSGARRDPRRGRCGRSARIHGCAGHSFHDEPVARPARPAGGSGPGRGRRRAAGHAPRTHDDGSGPRMSADAPGRDPVNLGNRGAGEEPAGSAPRSERRHAGDKHRQLSEETAMSILQATAVTKDYSGRTGVGNRVLRGVDLAVEAGQFVAVMGPSGSGKTTLLNILSGMDRPTGGSVSVSGHDISAMTEKDLAALRLRRLGFVFQSPHLMRTLSLLDNVVLPGFLAGDEPRAEIVARGRALMDDMGIADLAKSDVTQVSGGQLQRAGICRALINEPEILIGDEPTGALNSAAAAQILDILDRVRSRGTTVVLVTHDPAVAVRADRVVLLVDGRVVEDVTLGRYEAARSAERTEAVSALLSRRGV